MIISQTAIYALKAVMYLAEVSGSQELARVDDIAKALDVPRNYLSKILHVLARAGLLDSTRGPHGGFRLAATPTALSLAEVIGHFDDEATGSGCLLGRERCSDDNPCAAHAQWKDVSDAVQSFFNETTVSDLAKHGPGIDTLNAGAAGHPGGSRG